VNSRRKSVGSEAEGEFTRAAKLNAPLAGHTFANGVLT
jgi:hypothetical protein